MYKAYKHHAIRIVHPPCTIAVLYAELLNMYCICLFFFLLQFHSMNCFIVRMMLLLLCFSILFSVDTTHVLCIYNVITFIVLQIHLTRFYFSSVHQILLSFTSLHSLFHFFSRFIFGFICLTRCICVIQIDNKQIIY